MKKKNILSLALLITLPLAVTLLVWANVPPDRPPVNQIIGIPDVDYNDLREEDCRFCHENPDLVEGNTNIPDRHHLLYGSPIPENSQVKDPDANNDGTEDTTYGCLNCHTEDTTGGIITMVVYRNCAVDCHVQSSSSYPSVHHRTAEAQGGNCVHCHGTLVENPLGCKELYCAVASSSAGSTRGVPLIPCTIPGTTGTECDEIRVCRDTTDLCIDNDDCAAGSCTDGLGGGSGDPCHVNGDCPVGEICDGGVVCSSAAYCGLYGPEGTCDDGHAIPTYEPSLVTPARSQHEHVCEGTTAPCNYNTDCTEGTCSTSEGTTCHVDLDCPEGETCVGGVACVEAEPEAEAPGGCAYCHNAGEDIASGLSVIENYDTHHGAGVHRRVEGGSDISKCVWCHKAGFPHTVYGEEADHIRWCENCHGYESLHNIQVDSDNTANEGTIVVGGENEGWGHIGNDEDCWGCHGYAQVAESGSGPLTPFLAGSDTLGVTSGYDTTFTLIGATLQNFEGSYLWTSDVTMTGADGSAVTLTPESISISEMTVTIPAATSPGNYALRAVKGSYAASNPLVIAVKPAVVIADSSCNRKKGVLSITGSGFGEKPAGTDDYINVQVGGRSVAVTSWSDTLITAAVSSCSNNAAVTVKALMGTATSGGNGGKPAKPCKGKGCNR